MSDNGRKDSRRDRVPGMSPVADSSATCEGSDSRCVNIFDAAQACLAASLPADKLALTAQVATELEQGRLGFAEAPPPMPIDAPGRPERPRLVNPRHLARRGLGSAVGRAALIHAIAHIEFNAIDLAWDAVYRFRGMPEAYYRDWTRIAADEARHYTMLAARLAQLGHTYGDFDAHDGLWSMAVRTAGSCLERMALVPRVLEARGLDVTPGMIERLRAVGDQETVAILAIILREEVAHVAAGTRWFEWCCARESVEPEATFRTLLENVGRGSIRGPFNREARHAAGFSAADMSCLDDLAVAVTTTATKRDGGPG